MIVILFRTPFPSAVIVYLPPRLTLPVLNATSNHDMLLGLYPTSNHDSRCRDFIQPPTATHKIQKVTGGLTRLASRTKVKKEETIRVRYSSLSHYEVADWTLNHVALVKELVEVRTKQHQQNQVHMQRYVFEEWLQTETELTRERGLWGPVTPCRLDKWMLDMTEGPSRMRKKMMKNELFYLHYPYRPELDYGDNSRRSPQYSAPMRTPLSIDSLGGHYRSQFPAPMGSSWCAKLRKVKGQISFGFDFDIYNNLCIFEEF
uniref:Uncharacterized protein n=1 Tax=Timema douglasi TaxID=61478 RepID=A0A7R8VJN0_TIMDO|nr:unnamed protein product [Timema douglasi]